MLLIGRDKIPANTCLLMKKLLERDALPPKLTDSLDFRWPSLSGSIIVRSTLIDANLPDKFSRIIRRGGCFMTNH